MNQKQKLALFADCYRAEIYAAIPQQLLTVECFSRGVSQGRMDVLRCLGLLTDYEEWKSQQEG